MTPLSRGLGAGSRQEVSESNTLNERQFQRLFNTTKLEHLPLEDRGARWATVHGVTESQT